MLSNSHLSLAAGEFARDTGQYDEMHEGLFHAYFTECKDIDDITVVLGVAQKIGLDVTALEHALTQGTYEERLAKAAQEVQEKDIIAAPTFFIPNQPKIVGAVPMEVFVAALDRAMGRELKEL